MTTLPKLEGGKASLPTHPERKGDQESKSQLFSVVAGSAGQPPLRHPQVSYIEDHIISRLKTQDEKHPKIQVLEFIKSKIITEKIFITDIRQIEGWLTADQFKILIKRRVFQTSKTIKDLEEMIRLTNNANKDLVVFARHEAFDSNKFREIQQYCNLEHCYDSGRTALILAAGRIDIIPNINNAQLNGQAISTQGNVTVNAYSAVVNALSFTVTPNKEAPAHVKALIEAKADPNTKDVKGQTPLMHAAKVNQFVVAEDLILAGADYNAEDKDKKTALILASDSKSKESIEVLSFYLAKGMMPSILTLFPIPIIDIVMGYTKFKFEPGEP